MASRIEWKMAHTVRCPDGTLLRKGDRVERFHPKYHRRRITNLAQLETANITAAQIERRAEGQPWLQPVKILWHGKLLVVERKHLTVELDDDGADALLPPSNERPQQRVRWRQGELLD